MDIKKYLWFSILCLIIGLLYSAFNNELLVVRLPSQSLKTSDESPTTTKKKVTLNYWHHGAWHTETNTILWSDNTMSNLTNLISCWLSMLDEERVTTKKIGLESVLLNAAGNEAFLSLSRYPFNKEGSTYDKWQWVEGLLKTIRENNISLQSIRLLVHHQELVDAHLDFSHSWPITGFLTI